MVTSVTDVADESKAQAWREELKQACRSLAVQDVRRVLDFAKSDGAIDDRVYREGLRSALSKALQSYATELIHVLLVNYDAAQFLSENSFSTCLHRAVGTPDLLRELLKHGADIHLEVGDRYSQTPLFNAVVKGDLESAQILLAAGAVVDAVAQRRRTALIHLAAEGRLENDIIELHPIVEWLVAHGASLQAADAVERCAIHWAALNGLDRIVQALLAAGSDVDAQATRERTALHLICGVNPSSSTLLQMDKYIATVQVLLAGGADPKRRCDGGRTALLIASQEGNTKLVELLLRNDVDVNAVTDKGDSALHWAAGQGHLDVVRLLLQHKDVDRRIRDGRGRTPLWRAVRKGHQGIVQLLSPKNLGKALSADEEKAMKSEAFLATVVQFESRVADGNYNRKFWQVSMHDLLTERIGLHGKRVFSNATKRFRWFHIPTNNLSWVELVIEKLLIEDQGKNFDAIQSLQRTLGERSKGREVHSRCQRIRCTYIPPSSDESDTINGTVGSNPAGKSQRLNVLSGGALALSVPYLHYEDLENQRLMSNLINHAAHGTPQPRPDPNMSTDDCLALMRAYINAEPNYQPRRTLDQHLFHNFDTKQRDDDQTLLNYCRDNHLKPELIMVDQLWIYVLGPDLLVTSFPYRGHPSRRMRDNIGILSKVIDQSNLTIKSVDDLAVSVVGACLDAFELHHFGPFNVSCMDVYESVIGQMSFLEPNLLRNFAKDAALAEQFINQQETNTDLSNLLKAVDSLSQMRVETDLLIKIKDVREELSIIQMVFRQQKTILLDLGRKLSERASVLGSQTQPWENKLSHQMEALQSRMDTVQQLDDQAEGLTEALTQLLDYKKMHAAAFEGCFARRQTLSMAKQGQTILVFTIVTIIFLPISFIATFFSIELDEYSGPSGSSLTLGYVSKYTFGIGLSISLVLVMIAFQAIKIQDRLGGTLVQYVSNTQPQQPASPMTGLTRPFVYSGNEKTALSIRSSLSGRSREESVPVEESSQPSLPSKLSNGYANFASRNNTRSRVGTGMTMDKDENV